MKADYGELQEASALNAGPTKTQLEGEIASLTKWNKTLTNELGLAEAQLHLINKSYQKEIEDLKRQLLALSNKNTSLTDKVNNLQAQLSIYEDQEQ